MKFFVDSKCFLSQSFYIGLASGEANQNSKSMSREASAHLLGLPNTLLNKCFFINAINSFHGSKPYKACETSLQKLSFE